MKTRNESEWISVRLRVSTVERIKTFGDFRDHSYEDIMNKVLDTVEGRK